MSLYEALKKSDNPRRSFNSMLTYKASQSRYLLHVLLELSPICNFSCPFCYVRQSPQEMLNEGKHVLRFSFWKSILDQLFEMGVMYVKFTGGECMLHPDFVEIYEYAAKKGFFVSLISNGSSLTSRILDMFKRFPPSSISITVYGGSERTYQKICGNGEYYQKVMTNLQLLSEANIPFSIQMTVSRDNINDIQKIYELSKRLNVRFSCGHILTSQGQCTEETQEANSVTDDEYEEMTRFLHRAENKGKVPSPMPVPQKSNINGIGCSAGRSIAFINHEGMMYLCVSYQENGISTFEHSLKECWREIVEAADQIPHIEECDGCIHFARCTPCFGAHYYDTGNFTTPSPKICFKRKHPEKAARIEAYYAEHGVLPPWDY